MTPSLRDQLLESLRLSAQPTPRQHDAAQLLRHRRGLGVCLVCRRAVSKHFHPVTNRWAGHPGMEGARHA